jgi:hypothetical protein
MNCGCSKHIGCFAPNQTIDFGLTAPCSDDYVFEIWNANGTFTTISVELETGDPLTLPMTFNENATTTIKIRVPDCASGPGFYYFTTSDGACSWTVDGISPVC